MSKRKTKLTSIDFILIILIISVFVFSIFRSQVISNFNDNNVVKETLIAVSVTGVDKNDFTYYKDSNAIYVHSSNGQFKIGDVTAMRSTPSVRSVRYENEYTYLPDFSKVDVVFEIVADCLYDQRGFCSIDGNYLAPGCKFYADNGKIKFDCEVVSLIAQY